MNNIWDFMTWLWSSAVDFMSIEIDGFGLHFFRNLYDTQEMVNTLLTMEYISDEDIERNRQLRYGWHYQERGRDRDLSEARDMGDTGRRNVL